jgi:hypothetical protein
VSACISCKIRAGQCFSIKRACPISKCKPLLYFRSLVRLAVYSDDWVPLITSIVNGHWKESKTKEATAPAAAGSARDMLSAGAGAGATSGAAADPRAAVEAAVSAAPDDPSEGDKFNLAINIVSASAADMALGACSTSACRSGPPPAATFSGLVLLLSCITDFLQHHRGMHTHTQKFSNYMPVYHAN